MASRRNCTILLSHVRCFSTAQLASSSPAITHGAPLASQAHGGIVSASEVQDGIGRWVSSSSSSCPDTRRRDSNRGGGVWSFQSRHFSTYQQPEAAAAGGNPENVSEVRQAKNDKEEAKGAEEREEVEDGKTQTLRAALAYVPTLGWTEAALAAGARDVGLSPAMAGAFPQKEAALVEFFMDECAHALVDAIEAREEELGKLVLQDRIAMMVWMRLEMLVPYLSRWAQALSIQANPANLSNTLKQRAVLIDEIWHAAGDRSRDMDWYAKRALLAGVYSTTELYMLTDKSPDFMDTKAFLERRINDAVDCRKTLQEVGHLAQAVGAGLQNTMNSVLDGRRPSSGFGF